MANVNLMKKVVNRILSHPELYTPMHFVQGDKNDFAALSIILSGKKVEEYEKPAVEARILLGISGEDADWLFDPRRTIGEIYAFVKAHVYGFSYFDVTGHDAFGYDRDGLTTNGFNRNHEGGNSKTILWGYDKHGRDAAGYNEDGIHKDGSKITSF